MASMLDRGDSYKVHYLGSNMLAVRAVTGLGVLQKPLMQMYFRYQKDSSRSSVRLQERLLIMNDKGMIVSSEGGADIPNVQESYAMPSILFWDAVRFVSVRTRDKKVRAAFEPLDADHSRDKENLFVTLDKSLHFLHKKQHLPLFCCVLRRTQGLKALDVHAFVCHSDQEALGLIRALDTVNISYTSEEQQETGVFGYNPFGKESIRSAAGLQLSVAGGQSSLDKRHADICRHKSAHFRPSEGALERPSASKSTNRSVSVRNKTTRAKSPHRPASRDFKLFTGSQPNLSVFSTCSAPDPDPELRAPGGRDTCSDRNSRVFLLSQSDFSSQLSLAETDHSTEHREVGRTTSEASIGQKETGETYSYVQHINKTLDRKGVRQLNQEGRNSSAAVPVLQSADVQMRNDKPNHYSSEPETLDQHADGIKHQPAFDVRGIFQEDKAYSADDRTKDDKQPLITKMGQGYSLLSRSNGPLPGYAPHQSSRQPYAPSPTGEDRPPSNFYQQSPAPANIRLNNHGSNVSSARDLNVIDSHHNVNQFAGVSHSERTSQADLDTCPAPRIPTRTPILRKADSFKREVSLSPERRQTIQGTVMAQLTPHSERGASPFTNRRGPPGVGSSGWDNELPGSHVSNQPPTHSKPIAKVPPHKVQGVKVLPSQPSFRKQDGSGSTAGNILKQQDNYVMRNSKEMGKDDGFVHRARPNSMYDDGYQSRNRTSPSAYYAEQKAIPASTNDIYAIVNKPKKSSQQTKTKNMSKSQESVNNWQFQKTPAKQSYTRKVNQSLSNDLRNFDDCHGESLIQSEKKDAEIASLLQNIHFDYEATLTPHAPHGTNFEKSLGYFP